MYKIDMISIKKKKCRKTRKLLKGGGNNIPKKMTNKRNFLIDACYEGKFTRWFKDNMKQNILNKGSMLMYNCRVLHSGMTNNTSNPRPALLINYCEKDIIERIKPIDNIWNSNVQI